LSLIVEVPDTNSASCRPVKQQILYTLSTMASRVVTEVGLEPGTNVYINTQKSNYTFEEVSTKLLSAYAIREAKKHRRGCVNCSFRDVV
jgi:hypothetical protein